MTDSFCVTGHKLSYIDNPMLYWHWSVIWHCQRMSVVLASEDHVIWQDYKQIYHLSEIQRNFNTTSFRQFICLTKVKIK